MCYGSPAKSLEIARSRLTPEQWQRFEREFDDFCVVQGLLDALDADHHAYDWAKWAYFCAGGYGDHCQCDACRNGVVHESCCAVHNEPAYPNGPCDCSVADAKYTRLALAMMDDEQAEQSLERWMGRGE